MKPGPLMLDLMGPDLLSDERELIQNPGVGGIIFFARNFQSKKQLLQLVADIRELRPDILLAVDQEGGRVQRFKEGFTRFPPMQTLGLFMRDRPGEALALARDCGWLLAAEILACDIDFSFAPVLDADDEHCGVIADRAFSADPALVVKLGACFIEGMREAGMAATGKHFPGHGSVSGDSHLELPVDNRRIDEVMATDGWCFLELMPGGVDALMPAHILFPKVDSQPVGFSGKWLQTILRGELGFEGVIFSDDLSMEGATGVGSYSDRAAQALSAGCDMVLACNNRAGALEVLAWLEQNKVESSSRLSLMAARKSQSWVDLEHSSRRSRVLGQLEALTKTYASA